jgi:NAD(P)-dependent dehydrogenase (short-subunit alcohol dehydrogenase family)
MNIIVNGATRGIGKEVAVLLAGEKTNKIVATGRNTGRIKELAEKFSNMHLVATDLSLFNQQKEDFRQKIEGMLGSVDILINMAGAMIPALFMETREEDARLMMESNLFGTAAMIRILQPLMHEGSHIVNISSMGGFQGSSKYPGLSWYSASKAAIACLSECLATEFSSIGIKVNCLALGAVQTDMLESAFPGYKAPLSAKEMAEFISDFA